MALSFSIIVPAYNEEENIQNAVESVIRACKSVTRDYEIVVVDDGSSDATGEIMEGLSKKNPKIKILHNKKNMGFGCAFRRGIEKASKEYIGGFPGDNDMSWQSLKKILLHAGEADIVSSYMSNPQARSFWRRMASRSYVLFMNLLFLLNLHYYNGHFVAKTKLLKKLNLRSSGIVVLGEVKVLLLKKENGSIKEVPFEHIKRLHGFSKILTVRGISQEIVNTLSLFMRVYFS